MRSDAITLTKPSVHWIVALKAAGLFDDDVKIYCSELKRIEDKGIVVSGSPIPFCEDYDGENIFIPIDDIYTIERVVSSVYGTKRDILFVSEALGRANVVTRTVSKIVAFLRGHKR